MAGRHRPRLREALDLLEGSAALKMPKGEIRYLIRRVLYGRRVDRGGSSDPQSTFNERELLEIFAFLYPYTIRDLKPSELAEELERPIRFRPKAPPGQRTDDRSGDGQGGSGLVDNYGGDSAIANLLTEFRNESSGDDSTGDSGQGDGVDLESGKDSR